MAGHLLEHHSTTGAYARNAENNEVSPNNSKACCWCLAGALMSISLQLELDYNLLHDAAGKLIGRDNLASTWDFPLTTNRLQVVEKLKSA